MMSDFHGKLVKDFEEATDYKEVTKSHELVVNYEKFCSGIIRNKDKRGGSSKRYYIITGETFKALLQSAQTEVGKITRKYFIKVETLANYTNQAMFRYIEVKSKESKKELEEQRDRLNRLHIINAELLTYKKLSERNEIIYLVSTLDYIKQGLIKVGRTNNLKARNAGHNTTHVAGDKIKVLREFRVNDAALVESIIHKKLNGLRPNKQSEFFMCPYNLLVSIVELIVNNDDEENNTVNAIVETVYRLKQKALCPNDWMSGLPEDTFTENMQLVAGAGQNVVAKFNVTNATEDQKKAFVRRCIDAYQKTIRQPEEIATTIVWKAFQGYLIQQLDVPKSKFKATMWRPLIKAEEKKDDKLLVKWR
jgi:phage anti-repressor protein